MLFNRELSFARLSLSYSNARSVFFCFGGVSRGAERGTRRGSWEMDSRGSGGGGGAVGGRSGCWSDDG